MGFLSKHPIPYICDVATKVVSALYDEKQKATTPPENKVETVAFLR